MEKDTAGIKRGFSKETLQVTPKECERCFPRDRDRAALWFCPQDNCLICSEKTAASSTNRARGTY